ncbi:hypothetical protein BofuT4_P024350.1 [Botrytis cinerea T4]|uniref:Uncharacterized protein n=1 Tax=Botryotinia fuckeliana (strain T4) TaxID=999810 RepID=G2YFS8_BOTF4|nr:hypothetical protein BofuT4_P024350.1 [Botrytis cinerea T4]
MPKVMDDWLIWLASSPNSLIIPFPVEMHQFEGLFGLFRVVELLFEFVCIEQMYDEHFAVIYTRIIYVAQPMHIGFVYLQLHYEHRFSRDFFPLSSRSVHKYLGVNERVTDYASAAHAQYNTG